MCRAALQAHVHMDTYPLGMDKLCFALHREQNLGPCYGHSHSVDQNIAFATLPVCSRTDVIKAEQAQACGSLTNLGPWNTVVVAWTACCIQTGHQ